MEVKNDLNPWEILEVFWYLQYKTWLLKTNEKSSKVFWYLQYKTWLLKTNEKSSKYNVRRMMSIVCVS